MLPNGYNEKDIQFSENKAYLSGYKQAIVDMIGVFDNLDAYKEDSLLAHELSEDISKCDELKAIVKDWMNRMTDETVISILDGEVGI